MSCPGAAIASLNLSGHLIARKNVGSPNINTALTYEYAVAGPQDPELINNTMPAEINQPSRTQRRSRCASIEIGWTQDMKVHAASLVSLVAISWAACCVCCASCACVHNCMLAVLFDDCAMFRMQTLGVFAVKGQLRCNAETSLQGDALDVSSAAASSQLFASLEYDRRRLRRSVSRRR